MIAEIGEPLARIEVEAKEELPPIEGCGWVDPEFDPMAQWRAKHSEVASEQRYAHPMPGVEAMPGWRGFVGWREAEPEANAAASERSAGSIGPREVGGARPESPADGDAKAAAAERPRGDEPTLNLGSISLEPIGGDEPTLDLGSISLEPIGGDEPTLNLGSISLEPTGGDEPTLDLGSISLEPAGGDEATLDLGSISLEPIGGDEATLDLGSISLEPIGGDEPTLNLGSISVSPPSPRPTAPPPAAKPPRPPSASATGLAPKLAGAKPLAHPGRLPKGFVLTVVEKHVLRRCNGRTSTTDILAEAGLSAEELTAFLKRCAGVKLVTFKR